MKKLQLYLNEKGGYRLAVDGVFGERTMSALKEFLHNETTKRRYGNVWQNDTILYIRTDMTFSDKFDDFGVVIKGGEIKAVFPASTTAGDFYVFNPLTVGGITGTAVSCEQYAHKSHTFVTARNWSTLWLKAPYFKQTAQIYIYRDGNKDRVVDPSRQYLGMFGINLHRAGISSLVGRWSAGCNVAPDQAWFEVCKLFNDGDVVSYCLIRP